MSNPRMWLLPWAGALAAVEGCGPTWTEHGAGKSGSGGSAGVSDSGGAGAGLVGGGLSAGGMGGLQCGGTSGRGIGGHAGVEPGGEGGLRPGGSSGSGGEGAEGGSGLYATCETFDYVEVGDYVVETNYWHADVCPGTQCLDIDPETAAFTVTEAPTCMAVASYPNVLYGKAFGTTSPHSVLPLPLSSVESATSNWSFSVGGADTDVFDIAYDIWFCPDDTCDDTGFNGGLELMIWVNHRNANGWQFKVGTSNLNGHDWDVWTANASDGTNSWTYLAYLIEPANVTSVTDFDLMSFFADAERRGYLTATEYLYAVQGGIELGGGGIPYSSESYSVSIR